MILPSRVTLMAWQHTYTVEGIRLFVLWQVTCSLRWNKRTKLQRMNDSDVISPYPGPRIGRRLQLISQLISQKSQRRTSYLISARTSWKLQLGTWKALSGSRHTREESMHNADEVRVEVRRLTDFSKHAVPYREPSESDRLRKRWSESEVRRESIPSMCLKEVSMLRKMKWKPSVRKGPSLPVSLREVSVSERCLLEGDDVRTESATGTNSILLSLRGVWLREMSVLEEDEVKVWSARGTQSTCLS